MLHIKKIGLLFITLLFAYSSNLHAQSRTGQNIYTTNNTTLFSSASDTANSISRLDKYSNLQVVDTTDTGWLHVKTESQFGYIKSSSAKQGKAVITHHSYRTGARCEDGTSSTATGRGACSHHGGVDYWLTRTRSSVRIID